MREHYFNFHDSNITVARVFEWCSENLKDFQWKFSSRYMMSGSTPVQIKSNKPTYNHPGRGDVRMHTGIVFYDKMDATAFALAFVLKEHAQ